MENTVKLLESIKLDLANAERIIIKKDQEFYKKDSDQFLPVWLLIIM